MLPKNGGEGNGSPRPTQARPSIASQAAWYRMENENGPKAENGKIGRKTENGPRPEMGQHWPKKRDWGKSLFCNLWAIFPHFALWAIVHFPVNVFPCLGFGPSPFYIRPPDSQSKQMMLPRFFAWML